MVCNKSQWIWRNVSITCINPEYCTVLLLYYYTAAVLPLRKSNKTTYKLLKVSQQWKGPVQKTLKIRDNNTQVLHSCGCIAVNYDERPTKKIKWYYRKEYDDNFQEKLAPAWKSHVAQWKHKKRGIKSNRHMKFKKEAKIEEMITHILG